MIAGKAPIPPEHKRVTRQFRVHPDDWTEFQERVGAQNASSTLRRLISLYSNDHRMKTRADREPDPAPDRRFGGIR